MDNKVQVLSSSIRLDHFDEVLVTLTDLDGTEISKTISKESYRKILYPSGDWIDVPRLPENVVHLMLNGKDFRVAVFVPAGIRDTLILKNADAIRLPYPNLLFYFSAEAGRLTDSKCFAIKESSLTDISMENELYSFPYGNVHSDGKICWGSIRLGSDYSEPAKISSLLTYFFSGSMNADLFSNPKGLSFENYVESMKDKERFDDETLVKKNYTVSNLFNH